MRYTAILAGAMVCVAAVALGQEVVPVEVVPVEDTVATDSSFFPLWEILQPFVAVILTTIAPVVGALLIAVLYKLFNFLGIKDENAQKALEAQFRDALHKSAEAALKYAIAGRVGPIGDLITGSVPPDLINSAIEYVRSKNPDTAAKVSEKDLAQIIMSKVPDVMATIAASAGTTAATDAAVNR